MISKEIQRKIKEKNKLFGIKTYFYYGDVGVLGYSEGDAIYINLNENTDEIVARTNDHELLHFFEDTQEFQQYKNEIVKREDIEELREKYKLNYYGIYSEEDIEAGIVDIEIAIDIIIEEGMQEQFFDLERRTIEERRYLNLNVRKNLETLKGLSKWEKIFAENYYGSKSFSRDGIPNMPQGKEKVRRIKADIKEELQALYELAEQPERFEISLDSKEIIREYEGELKALEKRGEADNARYFRNHPEEEKQRLAKKHSETIYAEYKHIVDFIKGADYEESFKVLMLRETLMKTYKRINEEEKDKTIVKKRELNKSIAGMMVLNKTVLDIIYYKLENYNNFANLYYAGIAIYNKTIAEKSAITIDGIETYGKGEWIKFEGKTSNEEKYLENAQKLSALVADTPWCTKELAASQLKQGDFYVFVDNEKKPHIAVKMYGNEIDEVRGIKVGNEQRVEEEYTDVVLSFLENNQEIKGGKEWFEGEKWNQRLIDLRKKIERGEFKTSDVEELNELLFGEDKTYKVQGGMKNSNREELMQSLNLVKDRIAEYYGCTEEEIYIGDIDFRETNYKTVPFVVIYGNAYFGYSNVQDLGKLQSVAGYADFYHSEVTDLGQLKNIGGYANFEESNITDLGQLQSIGGNANFADCLVKSLDQLQSIGGNVNFAFSKVTDLGQLQNIGGDADFRFSKITNLGKLKSIGGEIFDNQYNLKAQYEAMLAKKENAIQKSLTGVGTLFSEEAIRDLEKALREMWPYEDKSLPNENTQEE